MIKTKIFSTAVSAAASIAVLSAHVSAFYDNPIEKSCSYDYISQKGIICYSGAYYYKNGEALKCIEESIQLVLTPAEGITLTPELLGLPEKYTLTTDENTGLARLPKRPLKGSYYEMEEQKVYVRKAIRKGLIAKAETEYGITGKCVDEPRVAINLKEGTDIDQFIADYPEYELTTDNTDVPEEYKDHQLFSRAAEKDEDKEKFYFNINSDSAVVKGFGMESKSRIESSDIFIKTCDDIHSIYKREPFDEEYSYFEDPENIVWSKDNIDKHTQTISLYNNGKYYTNLKKKLRITFMTTDDYRNSSDFTDLPDKFDVYNPDWVNNEMSLKRQIDVNTIEELDEAAEMVKNWAEKGYITEPKIWRHYSYNGQETFYLCVSLKNTDDFEAVLKDYPEFPLYDREFYVLDEAITEVTPENYTGDYQNFILMLPKERYNDAWDIEKEMQNDSRFESVQVSISTGKTVYFDDDEMIEYTAPEIPPAAPPAITTVTTEEDRSADTAENTTVITTSKPAVTTKPYIKGDISGNGKIDLYDAIEIAKYILGTRKFTDEEIAIADIDDNGKVNIYDAIAIAKKIIEV